MTHDGLLERPVESAGRPGRHRNRRRRRWVVPAVVLLLATAGFAFWPEAWPKTQPATDQPATDPGPPVAEPTGPEVPGLTVGVTHTQTSPDLLSSSEPVTEATELLASLAPIQNQHLMGWGALNPEPSPGDYTWASLDRRIEGIVDMGAEPVLTLCCAPDWMKGGVPGETDWTQLEVAPTPEHFDDFAALAQRAALRYPEIRHFIVWNELKGFYDAETNDWDAAGYTELYNRVYTAVKEVRPDALIGGPYVVVDSWAPEVATEYVSSDLRGPWGVVDRRALAVIDYWLANAVGAEFIAMDGGTAPKDGELTTTDFAATEKFAAVTQWVRSRTDLPVWWTEVYAETNDGDLGPDDPRRAAVMAQALLEMAQAGASVALLWQPEARDTFNSAALFSDTSGGDGGRPLPLARLLRAMSQQLREDPRLLRGEWDPSVSRYTLTTPEAALTWSPTDGLRRTS